MFFLLIYVDLLMTVFLMIFQRFLTTLQRFLKTLQKLSHGHTDL